MKKLKTIISGELLSRLLLTLLTVSLLMFSCSDTETPPTGGETENPGDSTEPGDTTDPVYKEFILNNALQTNMVIQQQMPLNIWGEGDSGTEVFVNVSWSDKNFQTTVDKNGYWTIAVDVPAAPSGNDPQWFAASNGEKTITCKNVLIGEVWFLSGQSNMQMNMTPNPPWHDGVIDYQSEVAAADVPLLRHFTMWEKYSDTPEWNSTDQRVDNNWNTWRVCTPLHGWRPECGRLLFCKKAHRRAQRSGGIDIDIPGW